MLTIFTVIVAFLLFALFIFLKEKNYHTKPTKTFTISSEVYDRISEMAIISSDSDLNIIIKALATYDCLWREKISGNKIVVLRKNGEEAEVLIQ